MAGFRSECWPTSNRYGGRLRVGISGRLQRNTQLCTRYRQLIISGNVKAVAVTAIAREMAAFFWAIGQEVAPAA